MAASHIFRLLIPVAIIYIFGFAVPYIILTNINIGPSARISEIQNYIDKQQVSIPVSF